MRDAVLDATEARIASAGLAGLGMRGIAEQAGCSLGMIYKLYPNYDALVLAANARTLDAISAALRASTRNASTAEEAMCRMAEGYLAYALHNTARWDALFSHRMADGAQVPHWYVERRSTLFASLAEIVASALPIASQHDSVAIARMLFSAVHGCVVLGLEQKIDAIAPAGLAFQVRELVRLVAHGLGVRP